MIAVLTWAFLSCGLAIAGSRVVVSTPEPMQVFVDGMIMPTSIGTVRTTIPDISPGEHEFAFHTLTGSKLYTESVVIPDNADIRITYTPGAPLGLTGGATSSGQPTGATVVAAQNSNASGMATTGPMGPGPSQSAVPVEPTVGHVVEGSAVSTARATGLQRAMTQPTPTNLISGTGRGLKAMTVGARAGTNFGKPQAYQQAIKKPNVVYGRTILKKASGAAIVIYENGHMVAQLAAGKAEAVVELEVGRRELEIRSGVDYRVLFEGDLQVDQNHVETLNLSDTQPPRATVRPWLWKDM